LCCFQEHPLITTGKFLQYASHENWSSSTHLGEYVSYGYGIRMPRTVLYLTANWLCRKPKTDRRLCSRLACSGPSFSFSRHSIASLKPSTAVLSFPRFLSTSATFAREVARSMTYIQQMSNYQMIV